jgi:GNAT superfamily N-acetyltransferase
MDFHLAEIDLSSDPGAQPSRWWEGHVSLVTEDHLATFGYTDLVAEDTADSLKRLRRSTDHLHLGYLALAGAVPDGTGVPKVPATGDTSITADDVLADMWVELPLLDNEHLGYIHLLVRVSHRHAGIGSAMIELGERLLREHGRTTALGWSTVTSALTDLDGPTEATLLDPTGTVRVRTDDPAVRFAVGQGYSFSQAERHSIQPLPVPETVLADALAEGATKGAGYELVQFFGQPGDDLLEGLVPLFAAMATDPPLGAVDWRPQVWDAERVRKTYDHMTVGLAVYTTCARHVTTGELVAFTQLKASYDKPEVVYQENTVVLSPHRGHALGLWVKAANCEWITRDRPSSRRVHTWNADENQHMLAINTRLGYHQESISAAWQKVLD